MRPFVAFDISNTVGFGVAFHLTVTRAPEHGPVPRDEYPDAQGRTFTQAVADEVMSVLSSQGRSIRGVARESGMSAATLHGRLHGERPFNTDELAAIAVVLGVSPRRFVRG